MYWPSRLWTDLNGKGKEAANSVLWQPDVACAEFAENGAGHKNFRAVNTAAVLNRFCWPVHA
jgi:hypothetical protein